MTRNAKLGKETTRLSAQQIFESVLDNAREELSRPSAALFFSGTAGGLTMGLTGLSVAMVSTLLGGGKVTEVAAALVYPIGFVAVIIGRAQLFTENTLYPVALVLTDRRHLSNTLRLWTVVYAGNWVGSLAFAALVVKTPALQPSYRDELRVLGLGAVNHPFMTVFWSAVVAGWLLALVAWLVTASHWTTGQAVMTWILTFILGLGEFAHCVANSGEILFGVLGRNIPLGVYGNWLLAATLGNIAGGVVMVSLINYGQVRVRGGRETALRKTG
jgi:formate-nitrite transporter family protein